LGLPRIDPVVEPFHGRVFSCLARRRTLPKVNIRSIVAPTLSRYPTEYQWEELEELLRRAVSQMPRQTLPEALADEPARTVLEEWRHRHWLDESASFLP
jgi:hypothetical protein